MGNYIGFGMLGRYRSSVELREFDPHAETAGQTLSTEPQGRTTIRQVLCIVSRRQGGRLSAS